MMFIFIEWSWFLFVRWEVWWREWDDEGCFDAVSGFDVVVCGTLDGSIGFARMVG